MREYRENAPAKINLALHVTGRREDGYHLLDTLVTFADRGDVITVREADQDALSLSGPFSHLLEAEALPNNLVLKARDGLRQTLATKGISTRPVAIHLEKNLPIASGIGGGSADAAATLRALIKLWHVDLNACDLQAIALRLGADVPMCLHSRPLRATGIGDAVLPLPTLPRFGIILGNPLKTVSTPSIFKALTRRDYPAIGMLPLTSNQSDWLKAISDMRNDLEPVARQLCPEIATLTQLISDTGAELTRMSGSGATCFGLYQTLEKAEKAVKTLQAIKPDWYFQAANSVSEV
ncbi:4-(cytidine 5'-diphospho)-2-C-methyl-D-erythritol kinase [Rhizobium oryziradicis]|uniref:4-diphosphocytidyl-2-C-methyl-D-erythritol kinase n=1 Tax=Rhizobium oryziradicis TaxID=1867956 RepID=A0A1Q8ZUQ3_9HYPH|nr:4-(cytidine 5'-diphospho)-2-C-methyl-D-erythritol kinase [Rhizobium oryziradicis]OLP45679.1 4-(cytidine 5'-diphospho)-2-C-methyl-D-erythritol kinase [Rhizobium oryziradicis]